MSDYGKLMSRIWGDKDFTALNAREQQVFMMLFSFPTRNLAGMVPLTIRRWSTCTADATLENIRATLEVLIHERFILIDWDTEEVLIRTYIRNDEVWRQPNLMTRCLKFCETVASEKLRCSIAQELIRIAQELMPMEKPGQQKIRDETLKAAKALVETFAEGFLEPSEIPSREPFPETLPGTFAEPPGVGGYVSSTYTPAPAPAPDTDTTTDTKPPAGVSQGVGLVEDEPSTKDKRARRLNEDWQPTTDVIARMKTRYPTVDLRDEFQKFQNHHIGKGTKWVDWNRAWWNWIAGAAERRGVSRGHNANLSRPSTTDAIVAGVDALRDNPRRQPLLSDDRKELLRGS